MHVEIVPDLMISLGMSEREAKLYAAMLEKPEWKSGELHRITGVPRAQTHQTLESMVSKQYCKKRSEGRFNYYSATPPDILHDILTRQWNEEVSRRVSRADTLFESLHGIYAESMKEERSLDFIEIIQTPHRIHKRFVELLANVQVEGLAFNRSPYSYMSDGYDKGNQEEQTNSSLDTYERGVKCRSIFMYEEDVWDNIKDGLEVMEENEYDETRVVDFLPGKMFIFDRKITMININSISREDKIGFNQIIIHDASFAAICAEVFELYWSKSLPYREWKALQEKN